LTAAVSSQGGVAGPCGAPTPWPTSPLHRCTQDVRQRTRRHSVHTFWCAVGRPVLLRQQPRHVPGPAVPREHWERRRQLPVSTRFKLSAPGRPDPKKYAAPAGWPPCAAKSRFGAGAHECGALRGPLMHAGWAPAVPVPPGFDLCRELCWGNVNQVCGGFMTSSVYKIQAAGASQGTCAAVCGCMQLLAGLRLLTRLVYSWCMGERAHA